MSTLADLLFRTVDGVFAVDAQQRVVLWNPGCAQLFGIPSTEALGRPCGKILQANNPCDRKFCAESCFISRLPDGGQAPKPFPLRARDRAGKDLSFWVNIALVPSQRTGTWTYVHLLHRCQAPDALEILADGAGKAPPRRRTADKNPLPSSIPSTITARELEILKLLSEGLVTRVIAKLLSIRLVTVRNHIQHIQAKLGVHSRAETVAYAYRHNLVYPQFNPGISRTSLPS